MTPSRPHPPVSKIMSAALCCSILLFGCVSAPDDAVNLDDGAQLDKRSDGGLVTASIGLLNPKLTRGVNDFTIALEAKARDALPSVVRFDATMPAHGHEATATLI